ncbi:outer membrane protein assembly factor BamE [Halomonas sp. WWR20]
MQNLIKTVTFSVALTLVSGCSYFGVYKRDLPQGNLITQDMLEQLKPGMTREQVQYIMGSPLLETPFARDQWDYVFYLDEAYGGTVQKRVTLSFQGERLADISKSGDIDADVEMTSDTGPGPATETTDALPNLIPSGPSNAPRGGAPSSTPTDSELP